MSKIAATALTLVVIGGCAGVEPAVTTDPASPPTTQPGESLPPHTADALAQLFDPLVAPLGFRVTRASLVDVATYRASAQGTHLAVYVAPRQPLGADGHARSFLPLATAFLPGVFERWPGLESFDVCQEPHEWTGRGVPPSVTLIDVDRDTAASIDWATVTLADLIARAGTAPHLVVTASSEVAASPTWTAAAG